MNNKFISFSVTDFNRIKQQILNWGNQFDVCCFLDNNEYSFEFSAYECIIGIGQLDAVTCNAGNALYELQKFQQQYKGCWMFGHLGYDLKNEIEAVFSSHFDNIGFSDLFFFVPQIVLLLNKNELIISSNYSLSEKDIFTKISEIDVTANATIGNSINIQSRFSKQQYIQTIEALKKLIQQGYCYEINFCYEFFAEQALIDPLTVYKALTSISPAPFAAYYKVNDKYLLCASPERYLKKEGNKITSQPIKGTSKRNLVNKIADENSKIALQISTKNRSENVMVVDLVRNDLSKICTNGSVKVEELFKIYSFPQVHQMISTVSGRLHNEVNFTDIVKDTFPMGSMTGAPKKKVMELIEMHEKTKRGIFSGSVGYIKPDGDFDFNVVIRSILYNYTKQYVSYLVGSGITFYSNPTEEYEECLLKAAAIKKVLT